MFKKATKSQAKGRFLITGPSGAGKTYTALRVARGLVGPSGRIAVVDSEHGSASKYANEFDFDVCELDGNNHPVKYVKAIEEAENGGFDVVILDSLTHAWSATKDEVDRKKAADKFGNGFTAWAEGTKIWEMLTEKLMSAHVHVIATSRSKTEYAQETDDKGKKIIRKLGLAPEIRDGSEFSFDVVLEMEVNHWGRIGKTRCASLDGYAELKPGEQLGETLRAWLTDGAALPKPVTAETKALFISAGTRLAALDKADSEGAKSEWKDCQTDEKALALVARMESRITDLESTK